MQMVERRMIINWYLIQTTSHIREKKSPLTGCHLNTRLPFRTKIKTTFLMPLCLVQAWSGLVKCTLSSSLKINFGEQSTRLLIDMLAILKFIIFNKVAMVMSFPLNYIVCIIG